MKPKIELVSGWRTWWRQYSTWLAGVGSSLVLLAPELAEVLNYVWQNLPLDIKDSFPAEWVRYFGIALVFISIPAKYVRQRKLAAAARRDALREVLQNSHSGLGTEGVAEVPEPLDLDHGPIGDKPGPSHGSNGMGNKRNL